MAGHFGMGGSFAAWLGLVPRQYSSGDKQRMLGITKRGDPYLRMLLINGVVWCYTAVDKNRQPQPSDSLAHYWIASLIMSTSWK